MMFSFNAFIVSILAAFLTLATRTRAAEVDAYGDLLPAGARFRLGTGKFEIGGGLSWADLSPDGRSIAYLGDRDYLTFKNVVNGSATTYHRLQTTQAHVAVAPGGKRCAIKDQGNLFVLDLKSRKRLASVEVRGFRPDTWAPVEFSADAGRIATVFSQAPHDSANVVWDVERNAQVLSVPTPAAERAFVALSPDGKQLATWGFRNEIKPRYEPLSADDADRAISIWNVESGKLVHSFVPADGTVDKRLRFSPDGATLAIVGRMVHFWDTSTWKIRASARGVERTVNVGNSVAFSPDGKQLAVLDAGGTVHLYESASGKILAAVQGHAPGRMVRFVENDRAVVVGGEDYRYRAWEVPSGKMLTPFTGHLMEVQQVAFTSDGKQLLSISEDGVMFRWNVSDGANVVDGGMRPADYARWLRSRELLEYVSVDESRAVFGWPSRGAVRVFDLPARKELFAATRQYDMTWENNAQISQRGTRLVLKTGFRSGYPTDARPNTVWDTTLGCKLFDFPQRDGESAFFSSDDRFLIVLGRRDADIQPEIVTAIIRDGATGKKLAEFESTGTAADFTAGMSPDGRTLVVSSRGRQVDMFDLPSACRRMQATRAEHAPQSPVVFSPDGRLFTFGQGGDGGHGVLQVWETASGSVRHRFDGHGPTVQTVAFSPDGRLLASGSNDCTIVIWDLDHAQISEGLRAAKMSQLWGQLRIRDAAAAHEAMIVLLTRADETVAHIGEKLQAVPAGEVSRAEIEDMIARLDDDDFQTREGALDSLIELGRQAEAALKAALADDPAPEVEQRIRFILAAAARGPTRNELRALRAVELLERVASDEAREVLRRLAGGRKSHPLTESARQTLERLAQER